MLYEVITLFRLRLQKGRQHDDFASALRQGCHPFHLSGAERRLRGLPQLLLPREVRNAETGQTLV